jgi:serine-type D-Ala-D-Ala endopeptidase (penicillin-binding protein 7)
MRTFIAVVAAVALGGVVAPAHADAPKLKSKAAIVVDARSGDVVWSKRADDVRDIASMTKIFVAMVVRERGLDLTGWSTISAADVAASDGGARTRLPEGSTWRNHDLLRAMLMVSDNRAPTALGRAVGLDTDQLIAAMNELARDLGLTRTRFVDTTGIGGNVSTARELAVALRKTLDDDVVAAIMTTTHVRIRSKDRKHKADYRHTVAALHDGKYTFHGAKSGHTRAAGYGFMAKVDVGTKTYVVAFLGTAAKKTRYVDFDKVASWLVDRQAEAAARKVAATR